MNISKIMNAISKMNLDEQQLLFITAQMSIEDIINALIEKGDIVLEEETYTKDLPSEDEEIFHNPAATYLEGWAMYANALQEEAREQKMIMTKVRNGRNHTTRLHLKDKAKAGWHGGAARQGYGRYDMLLKPERLEHDFMRDMETQIPSLMPNEALNHIKSSMRKDLNEFFMNEFKFKLDWLTHTQTFNLSKEDLETWMWNFSFRVSALLPKSGNYFLDWNDWFIDQCGWEDQQAVKDTMYNVMVSWLEERNQEFEEAQMVYSENCRKWQMNLLDQLTEIELEIYRLQGLAQRLQVQSRDLNPILMSFDEFPF